MNVKTAHLVVEGRVQGVCYRMYTEQKAKELGLKGSVKNLFNGFVEIFAQGDEEKVNDLIEWCWDGSPASHVTDIKIQWLQENEELPPFSTKY
ncbi:MAG: acylphosphatase [Nitrospinae bacterium]|nr:acylphosphatase [Nitrospinota bacterium]